MKKCDVSDHAVLRWLERVRGLDIDAVKAEIREKVYPAVAMGATCFAIGDTRFAIENGVITTVMTRRQRKNKAWRGRAKGRRRASEFEEIDL